MLILIQCIFFFIMDYAYVKIVDVKYIHNSNGIYLYITDTGTSLTACALSGKTRWVSSRVNFLFLAGEDNSTCLECSNSTHHEKDFMRFSILLFINDDVISTFIKDIRMKNLILNQMKSNFISFFELETNWIDISSELKRIQLNRIKSWRNIIFIDIIIIIIRLNFNWIKRIYWCGKIMTI